MREQGDEPIPFSLFSLSGLFSYVLRERSHSFSVPVKEWVQGQ